MITCIKFYKAGDTYGFMSNFYEAPIIIDREFWNTSEHYYQAQKFSPNSIGNSVAYRRIQIARTPNEAARLGRTLKGCREDWEEVKVTIMRRAVLAKFTQHGDLAKLLLETGSSKLIEWTADQPRPDAIWGAGADGKGQNLLGLLLMEIRSFI